MYNHLDVTDFQITIPKFPNVTFSAKTFSLPGISGSGVKVPSQVNPVNMAYDKIEYNPLSLSFIIDEDLTNYKTIFNWMLSIGADRSFSQHDRDFISDVIVVPYKSSENPLDPITFVNAFPESISDIEFSTSEEDVVYPTATITMVYDYYKFD